MAKAQRGITSVTNEQAYGNYRGLVEADIKGFRPDTHDIVVAEWTRHLLLWSRWMSRYSRRRDAIEGIAGFGSPLVDQVAKDLLVARYRAADLTYPEMPSWPAETLEMLELSLTNNRPANRLGIASLKDLCSYGPSPRRLWAEAKRRGETDDEAWQSIVAWAQRRPEAWDRDDARRKLRKPPVEKAMAKRLARPATWRQTGDLDRPWSATIDGESWVVRLNDFPDEWMYSLVVDGSPLGDLHDWPAAWERGESVAEAPSEASQPAIVAVPLLTAQGQFLERYRAGEREAVWAELVALGDAAREPKYLPAAQAVARETMRRARHNVETIIQRLDAMGYEFWDRQPRNTLFRWPRRKPRKGIENPDVFRRPAANERQELDALERDGIVLPLSLRAWIEEVGSVDLCGSHPALCFFEGLPGFTGVYADPLMVAPNADLVTELIGIGGDDDDLLISFDAAGKAGLAVDTQVDDQYSIEVPNRGADGPLKGEPHGLHFVEYLRLSFRWGGFAGWSGQAKRPERELAMLTDGLLEI